MLHMEDTVLTTLSVNQFVTEDSCNRDLSTLTLFTHEPATDNYADELQAVDTIQDFMKGGKRVVSKLRAVRGKS